MAKETKSPCNCKGTALFLSGLIDSDLPVDSFCCRNRPLSLGMLVSAGDLQEVKIPEQDCIIAFTPLYREHKIDAAVSHMGIINLENIRSLGSYLSHFTISQYV